MFTQLYLPLILAITATASPLVSRNTPITVSVARHFNLSGTRTILQRDQARAKVFQKRAKSNINVPIVNDEVAYIAEVRVGTPPQSFNLLVDTGSSNTWIGAGTRYSPSSTSTDTGHKAEVTYGSGGFSGEEFTDTVTVGELTILKQSIGVAVSSEGFAGVDGILGIGPTVLTEGTVSNENEVPTIIDSAFDQGKISTKEVGISFEPVAVANSANGQLTFGGVNTSKYSGTLNYVPITTTSPASQFVGVDQSITYGSGGDTILSNTAGIIDTGSTLISLATDAFHAYQNMTGATLDNDTGLLRISLAQYAQLKSLFFNIGGVSYELVPNAQIWPRSLNTEIGGKSEEIYLVIADLGDPSGKGLDFINGYVFLERFYHSYDSGNDRVGLAYTSYTYADVN